MLLHHLPIPVQEQNEVGVLFDGSGFAQIGERRLFPFSLVLELGERHDGDVELAGKGLQGPGNRRDLLPARQIGVLVGDEREIIDEENLDAAFEHEPARHKPKLERFMFGISTIIERRL